MLVDPQVSVIMPTYNGSAYISDALSSCLQQTLHDFELIVVDDGSTDSTPEILASIGDSRLRVARHSVNQKLPAALNTGFNQASSLYFIWMADDDLLAVDCLEQLVGYLDRHPEIDGVYADYARINEAGVPFERVSLDPSQISPEILNSPAFLYRRRVFEQLGGYKPEMFMIEDYEFWLRAHQQYSISYLPTQHPLYYLRQRGESLTGKYRWQVQYRSVELRREMLGLPWYDVRRQVAIVDVHRAYDAFRRADYRQTLAMALRALVQNPCWLANRGFLSILSRSILKSISVDKP